MITTTFVKTPGINLKLPQSSTSELTKTSRLVITDVSLDEIYLNKNKYQFAGFDQTMAAYTPEEKKELEDVIIEGDENVSYKLLVEVLDVLRKNGFNGANLKTTHSVQLPAHG
jgi:biopolymer transport protein ExbD